MARTLYLNADAASPGTWGQRGTGTNNAKLNGSTAGWNTRYAEVKRGGGSISYATSTEAGPTNGVEVVNVQPMEFWSPPLAADVTISGSMTFNIIALESSMSANVAINVVVEKEDGATGALTQIIKTTRTTELGTGSTTQNWSETPTSTACKKGDRLRFRVFGDDAGASTMASGYTFTVYFSGTVAGGLGDTWVQFTEDLRFNLGHGGEPPLSGWMPSSALTGLGTAPKMAYGNGYWVIVGTSGSLYHATTPDGTWTSNTQGTSNFRSVSYGNGYWVAVGDSGTLYYATDPTGTWTSNTQGTSIFTDVFYGNGYWVAVGAAGTLYYKATDPTGTWTSNAQGSTQFNAVTYAAGYWVAVGSSSGVLYYKATDPTGSWTSNTQGTALFYDVAYGNGYWVAVHTVGHYYRATDPTGAWTDNTASAGSITCVWCPNYDGSTTDGMWVTGRGSATGEVRVNETPTGAAWPIQVPLASSYNYSLNVGGGYVAFAAYTTTVTVFSAAIYPAPFYIYPTDTASDVATAAVDRRAWTSRGGGVANDVTNTAAGWTSPIQTTDTAGGTVVDWWTPQLEAFTLGGSVLVNPRATASGAGSANASIRCEIAVCNSDGSSPTTWGVANYTGEILSAEAGWDFVVSGDDVSVTQGQRLRIRFLIDDYSGAAMASGYAVTMYYAGAEGATGDTFLAFQQTLTEYVSGPARVPYRSHMPQLLAH